MQIQSLDRRLECCEQPNRKTDASSGMQYIDAAADTLNGPGEIERALGQESRPLFFADHVARSLEQELSWQRFSERSQGAANAESGWQPCFEVQIAGAIRQGGLYKRIHIHA